MTGTIAEAAAREWRAASRNRQNYNQWDFHNGFYRLDLRRAVRQADGRMTMGDESIPVHAYEFRDGSILLEPRDENRNG